MSRVDLYGYKITGLQVAYYIVCKRKLWLFTHGLGMEKFSDYVTMGKLISEESFKRKKPKEVEIGESARIDFLKIGDEVVVHEVKKSKKLEEAHIWQVKYYIWVLKREGVNCKSGVIHYPRAMRKIDVEFNEEDERRIEEAIEKMREIIEMEKPPPVVKKGYCRKCAYYDFCFV